MFEDAGDGVVRPVIPVGAALALVGAHGEEIAEAASPRLVAAASLGDDRLEALPRRLGRNRVRRVRGEHVDNRFENGVARRHAGSEDTPSSRTGPRGARYRASASPERVGAIGAAPAPEDGDAPLGTAAQWRIRHSLGVSPIARR